MSHMKIATKILEVIRQIPIEQELGKLNEVLSSQKLISKTKYQIEASRERTTVQGVVWQLATVSCELTIIDAESDEEISCIALGSGVDHRDKAIPMAQMMARRYAWLAVLNIEATKMVDVEPEIIVETPESKLIAQIKALWKWGESELEPYFIKRRGKPLSELNLPELTVEKQDLEGYIRGNR